MKLNIEFLQTGGVPLTNDLMAKIMEAIQLYDAIGELAGHMTIIAGCDPVGGSTTVVSPGVVAINGEVLFFEGGTIDTHVFVHEEQIAKPFQDQTNKVLIKKRAVKFGNSVPPNQYTWADFIKIQTLKYLQESIAQKANQTQVDDHELRIQRLELKTAPIENDKYACVFMRPANEIPAGWKECTSLRGKTIFGYDQSNQLFNNFGSTGGAPNVTLTKSNLPAIKIKTQVIQPYGSNQGLGGFDGSNSNQWNLKNLESETLGDGLAFSVLNPHRIVLFIEPNF